MAELLYPTGYGQRYETMSQMRARYEPRMHPEFARRLFAWLEHKQGEIGIGGGWRATPSDTSEASKRGESFHQDQRFASGFVGYSAVDLVKVDGPDSNHSHDGLTWEDSEDAPEFGLHTFIKGEPWHMQCIEMRGYATWVKDGRPDPQNLFPLPFPPLKESGVARAGRLIVKGYQDQLKVESIANPEHLIKSGLIEAPLIEVSLTAAQRKVLEGILGFALTPR